MTRLLIRAALLLLAVFACKPGVPPAVLSTLPVNGQTEVPLNTQIRVAFSEAMDTASVEAAFSFHPPTAGAFEWASESLMYWKPAQVFDHDEQCTFTIESTALSRSRLRLPRLEVSFHTAFDTTIPLTYVYMLGRSVMAGWFSHWGGSPYLHNPFVLFYHLVQSPPEIVTSVRAILDSITLCQPQPVVFFKLCFVDFAGGDSLSAQQNLDRNVAYVDSVYAAASGRGLKLIVGNALPQVASATDQWLVWNHRQYNQQLLDLEAQHPDTFRVFDLYSVLADSAGDLNPAYATNSGDSHPNDAGYTALDSAFFPFLETHY